jgi:16S rRNA (cytosine967-C5)-methyltransferase
MPSPARQAAYAVVRRVFEQGAYADRALRKVTERLPQRERAFATQLAYGTVQRKGTLDFLIEEFAQRSAEELDAPARAAIRLGLYQLAYLDGVAAHAAVDESVELVKADAPRAAGFVNAVLRRGAQEARALVAGLPDGTPAEAAIAYSVPRWLAGMWFEQLGAEEARALLAASNRPAEHALRANALVLTAPELLAALPVPAHLGEDPPESVVADAPFDAHGSPLFASGALLPQSRASQLVARAVDPQPGERILDLCAAPGGKTTHLAALMGATGEIVAVERNGDRAEQLRATAQRLHAHNVTVVQGDARKPPEGTFDRVLVDPPCSGLGTLRSRPDLRWRSDPQQIQGLVAEQRAIIDAAVSVLKPGGRLVYSTCTISPLENERQVRGRPDLELEQTRTTLPSRDDTDGFFIATMRRL